MGNPTSFISRLIEGIKLGSVLKPIVTPESLSSFIIGNSMDSERSKDEFSKSDSNNSNLGYAFSTSIESHLDSKTDNRDFKTDEKIRRKREGFHDDSNKYLKHQTGLEEKKSQVVRDFKTDEKIRRKREGFHDDSNKYLKHQTGLEEKKSQVVRDFKTDEKIRRKREGFHDDSNKYLKHQTGLEEKKSQVEKKSLISTNEANAKKSNLTRYRDLSDKFDILPSSRVKSNISNQQNVPPDSINARNNELTLDIIEKLQRNKTLKRATEATVTINIGKITVRAVSDTNSYASIGNESRKPKKMSLNDYLTKRSEER
jgi:hypothetical protein